MPFAAPETDIEPDVAVGGFTAPKSDWDADEPVTKKPVPQGEQQTTKAGYLSQLGSALATGTKQALAGAKTSAGGLLGFEGMTGRGLQSLAAAGREAQTNVSPEDLSFQAEMKQNAADIEQSKGFWSDAGEWIDYAGIVARNPAAAFKMGVQSAPNAIVSIPAMMIGNAAGGLAGAAAGIETGPGAIVTGIAGAFAGSSLANAAMEAGPAVYDNILQATNGEAQNWTADQFTAYIKQNPDVVSKGLASGAKRGAAIGAFDVASAGLAGKLVGVADRAALNAGTRVLADAGIDVANKEAVKAALVNPAIKSSVEAAANAARSEFTKAGNFARYTGATGIEMAGEGGGEAAAGLADTGKVDSEAVVQEMIGGIATGVPTALAGKTLSGAKSLVSSQQQEPVPQRTEEQGPDEIDAAMQDIVAGQQVDGQQVPELVGTSVETGESIVPDFSNLESPVQPPESVIPVVDQAALDAEAERRRIVNEEYLKAIEEKQQAQIEALPEEKLDNLIRQSQLRANAAAVANDPAAADEQEFLDRLRAEKVRRNPPPSQQVAEQVASVDPVAAETGIQVSPATLAAVDAANKLLQETEQPAPTETISEQAAVLPAAPTAAPAQEPSPPVAGAAPTSQGAATIPEAQTRDYEPGNQDPKEIPPQTPEEQPSTEERPGGKQSTVEALKQAVEMVGKDELNRRADVIFNETPAEDGLTTTEVKALAMEEAARLTASGDWTEEPSKKDLTDEASRVKGGGMETSTTRIEKEAAEIGEMQAKLKERASIYNASVKDDAAELIGIKPDRLYYLPYEKWSEIDKAVQAFRQEAQDAWKGSDKTLFSEIWKLYAQANPDKVAKVRESVESLLATTTTQRDATKPEQMTPEEMREASGIKPLTVTTFDSKTPKEDKALFVKELALSDRAQMGHRSNINTAASEQKPVSAAAVEAYGIKLPAGYQKQGDLYVFQPETPPQAPQETTPQTAAETGVVEARSEEGGPEASTRDYEPGSEDPKEIPPQTPEEQPSTEKRPASKNVLTDASTPVTGGNGKTTIRQEANIPVDRSTGSNVQQPERLEPQRYKEQRGQEPSADTARGGAPPVAVSGISPETGGMGESGEDRGRSTANEKRDGGGAMKAPEQMSPDEFESMRGKVIKLYDESAMPPKSEGQKKAEFKVQMLEGELKKARTLEGGQSRGVRRSRGAVKTEADLQAELDAAKKVVADEKDAWDKEQARKEEVLWDEVQKSAPEAVSSGLVYREMLDGKLRVMNKVGLPSSGKDLVRSAIRDNKPVSAAAVEAYGIKLPAGYQKVDELYIFQPETPPQAPSGPEAINDGEGPSLRVGGQDKSVTFVPGFTMPSGKVSEPHYEAADRTNKKNTETERFQTRQEALDWLLGKGKSGVASKFQEGVPLEITRTRVFREPVKDASGKTTGYEDVVKAHTFTRKITSQTNSYVTTDAGERWHKRTIESAIPPQAPQETTPQDAVETGAIAARSEEGAVKRLEGGEPAVEKKPRTYLNVPFASKESAKILGAKWDADQKLWYVEHREDGSIPSVPDRWVLDEGVALRDKNVLKAARINAEQKYGRPVEIAPVEMVSGTAYALRFTGGDWLNSNVSKEEARATKAAPPEKAEPAKPDSSAAFEIIKNAYPFKTTQTPSEERAFLKKVKDRLKPLGIAGWKIDSAVESIKLRRAQSGGGKLFYVDPTALHAELLRNGDVARKPETTTQQEEPSKPPDTKRKKLAKQATLPPDMVSVSPKTDELLGTNNRGETVYWSSNAKTHYAVSDGRIRTAPWTDGLPDSALERLDELYSPASSKPPDAGTIKQGDKVKFKQEGVLQSGTYVSRNSDGTYSVQVKGEKVPRHVSARSLNENNESQVEGTTTIPPKPLNPTIKRKKRGDAGFIDVEAIAHGIELYARGVKDFASWSARMVRRFGEAVRTHLKSIYQSITKGGFTNEQQHRIRQWRNKRQEAISNIPLKGTTEQDIFEFAKAYSAAVYGLRQGEVPFNVAGQRGDKPVKTTIVFDLSRGTQANYDQSEGEAEIVIGRIGGFPYGTEKTEDAKRVAADAVDEELIHAAEHSFGDSPVESASDVIEEVMAIRGRLAAADDSTTLSIIDQSIVNSWNLYGFAPADSVHEVIGHLNNRRAAPHNFISEMVRQIVQIESTDTASEINIGKLQDTAEEILRGDVAALKAASMAARSGVMGGLLQARIKETEAVLDGIKNQPKPLNALPTGNRAMPLDKARAHVYNKLRASPRKVRVINEPSLKFRGRYDPDGTITLNSAYLGSVEELNDVLLNHESIHDAIETDDKVRKQADKLLGALTEDERADIEADILDYKDGEFSAEQVQAERQVEAIRKLTANRPDLQSAWGRLVESVSLSFKKLLGVNVSRQQAELAAARILARGLKRLRKGKTGGRTQGGGSLYQGESNEGEIYRPRNIQSGKAQEPPSASNLDGTGLVGADAQVLGDTGAGKVAETPTRAARYGIGKKTASRAAVTASAIQGKDGAIREAANRITAVKPLYQNETREVDNGAIPRANEAGLVGGSKSNAQGSSGKDSGSLSQRDNRQATGKDGTKARERNGGIDTRSESEKKEDASRGGIVQGVRDNRNVSSVRRHDDKGRAGKLEDAGGDDVLAGERLVGKRPASAVPLYSLPKEKGAGDMAGRSPPDAPESPQSQEAKDPTGRTKQRRVLAGDLNPPTGKEVLGTMNEDGSWNVMLEDGKPVYVAASGIYDKEDTQKLIDAAIILVDDIGMEELARNGLKDQWLLDNGIRYGSALHQIIATEVQHRATQRLLDEKTPEAQAIYDAARNLHQVVGTSGGQSLGVRGAAMAHERYQSMFITEALYDQIKKGLVRGFDTIMDAAEIATKIQEAVKRAEEAARSDLEDMLGAMNPELSDEVDEPVEIETPAEMDKAEKKANSTAEGIITEAANRLGDPPVETEKQVNLVRELYRRHVENRMGKQEFEKEAVALRLNPAVAYRLWNTGNTERTARETITRYKQIEAEKRKDEAADKKARRLIYETMKRMRQSGYNEANKKQADSILKAFNDQVKKPDSLAKFQARLKNLRVSGEAAEALFETAKKEAADRAKMQVFKDRKALLEKDSPVLASLLNRLKGDVSWKEILGDPKLKMRERMAGIFDRVRKHEALQDLSPAEQQQLTVELERLLQKQRLKQVNKDLNAAGLNLPKKAEKAVRDSMPELLRLINLGTFSAETFRDAIAPKFGLKTLGSAEVKKVEAIAAKINDAPAGMPKRQLQDELLKAMQDITSATKSQIALQYWVSSVLSGGRTQFDTALSFLNGTRKFLQGASLAAMKGEGKVVGQAFQRYFKGLHDGMMEAAYYFRTGDPTMLLNFDAEMNAYLKGGQNEAHPYRLSEKIWSDAKKSGNWLKIPPAAVIMSVNRMMQSWDHINARATSRGFLPLAVAYNRKLYSDLKVPDQADYKAAEQQAEQILGKPKTWGEKVKVRAMANEILDASVSEDNKVRDSIINEAIDIGRTASYQNDPAGLIGTLYHGIKNTTANIVKKAESAAQEASKTAAKTGTKSAKAKAQAMNLVAFSSRFVEPIAGTMFLRFVGNRLSELVSLTPGLGAMRLWEKEMNETKKAMIYTDQAVGSLLYALGAVALYAMLSDDDDEDKRGWRIEGGWQGVDRAKQRQMLSEGRTPYSLAFKNADGSWGTLKYSNWSVAAILSTVGGMSDKAKYRPKEWNEDSYAAHIANAIFGGITSVSDISAISALMETLGGTQYGKDPVEGLRDRVNATMANFAGGFIPRAAKDLDYLSNPAHNKPDDLMSFWLKEIPVYRRSVGAPMMDVFGRQVQLRREPWSRAYLPGPIEPEYQIAGKMASRGLFLPLSDPDQRVVGKGKNRRDMTDEEKGRYVEEVGSLYKDFVLRYGEKVLDMEPDKARDFIASHLSEARNKAEKRSVR